MQVTAFSTPDVPDWRWRIVDYAGETIEESRETFTSIALAVAKGTERLITLNVVDAAPPARSWRTTSHLRMR